MAQAAFPAPEASGAPAAATGDAAAQAPAGTARPGKGGGIDAHDFTPADGWLTRTHVVSRTIYWGIHAACLLVFVTGAPLAALLLCAATYAVRVFAVTGVYHRYFSHKTYKTSRVFQFVLAFLGASATQKGPLWWSATHRRHHRYSDGPGDPHSPRRGFWYAHQGWIFDERWGGTPTEAIRDFARYPELVWLNRYHFVAPLSLALLCFAIGGFAGLVWGFAVSTTLLWHATYSINSLAHVWGTRRFETGDDSRNNLLLALLTFGEGWHNNHHHYMASARQGFRWWEVDVTYYVLRALSAAGLIWDLREPPASVLRDGGSGRDGTQLRQAA
jgi:stearoyl-CoA desaturase (Delta-9 desaturase)